MQGGGGGGGEDETKETERDQWMHVRVWSLNLLLFVF